MGGLENMEIDKVKELISAFKEAGLTSFSLKSNDFELKLKKEVTVIGTNGIGYGQSENSKDNASSQNPDGQDNQSHLCSYSNTNDQVNQSTQSSQDNLESTISSTSTDTKSTPQKSIKAPMVGTFYSASSPGAEPFVKVGDHVKKGDIVCVIEAMKLMNEVEAEEDGEIVEILVNNEDMVEYGQELFVVR